VLIQEWKWNRDVKNENLHRKHLRLLGKQNCEKKNRARFAENVTILLKTKAKKGLEEF
jgi:hypothetical protein